MKEIHTLNLEWGCVTNLLDRICTIENDIDGHWDELIDIISNMIDQESNESPENIFFNVYQYAWRLYYRLRNNSTKRSFNQISKINVAGEEVYRITNYDYKTFKWAKSGGLIDGISNDYIDLPADKLTANQRRAFDRRIGDKK